MLAFLIAFFLFLVGMEILFYIFKAIVGTAIFTIVVLVILFKIILKK